jgi:hypothetical protein
MHAFQNYLLICFWLMPGFSHIPQQNDAVFTNKKRVAAAQMIVPGKSVGKTFIGENMSHVFARLGKPDNGDAAMGKSMSFWFAKHDTSGYQTAVFASRRIGTPDEKNSRVQQVMVTSPYFKTAELLHTGSSYQEIAKKYVLKKAAVFAKGKYNITLYDTPKGISFEIGPDSLCKSIIVHLPNLGGASAYLAFHPAMVRVDAKY